MNRRKPVFLLFDADTWHLSKVTHDVKKNFAIPYRSENSYSIPDAWASAPVELRSVTPLTYPDFNCLTPAHDVRLYGCELSTEEPTGLKLFPGSRAGDWMGIYGSSGTI